MAVRAHGPQVFESRSYILAQLIQWHEMVCFGELCSEFSVETIEPKLAHLTLVIVLNLSIRREQSAPLTPEVNSNTLPILALRISFLTFIFRRCMRKRSSDRLKKGCCMFKEVGGVARKIVEPVECRTATVLFKDGQIELGAEKSSGESYIIFSVGVVLSDDANRNKLLADPVCDSRQLASVL